MGIASKKELETDIVSISGKRIYTNSLVYSKEFGFNHRDTLEKMRNLSAEYSAVRNEFKESIFINERNREYPFFEMTRDGFLTLLMQMGGGKNKKSRDRVFEKQQMFIKTFNKMEQTLLQANNEEYIVARKQGKIARREATDAVKLLLEYISNEFPESSYNNNPERAYSNYTKATYKVLSLLEHNKPKTREVLDAMELSQLYLAEHIISNVIIEEIEAKEHYKVIFEKCKVALEKFADSLYLKRI